MTLFEARDEIDKIDNEILHLLLKRLEISEFIGSIKKEANMSAVDKAREEEIFNNLKASSKDKYEHIEPIFTEILRVSKDIQKKKISQI